MHVACTHAKHHHGFPLCLHLYVLYCMCFSMCLHSVGVYFVHELWQIPHASRNVFTGNHSYASLLTRWSWCLPGARRSSLPVQAARTVLYMCVHVCAMCGIQVSAAALHMCQDCMSVSFCSAECRLHHRCTGLCELLRTESACVRRRYAFMPPSLCSRAPQAEVAWPTGVLNCTGVHRSTHRRSPTRAQAIAAEYAQCAQTHPHLQRVAQVILPPCGERHPDSPAVVAAHEMLVCAAGLLDDKDWEEIMRECGLG